MTTREEAQPFGTWPPEDALSAGRRQPWYRRYLLRPLEWIWDLAFDLGRVLWPCRASAVVLAGAALMLLGTEQGRESTLALAHASWLPIVMFFVALVMWIFMSWFWARLMTKTAFSLDRTHACKERPRVGQYGRPRDCGDVLSHRTKVLVDYTPRVIGSGSGILAAVGFALHLGESESMHYLLLAIVSFVIGAIASWLFYMRSFALRSENGGWLTRQIRTLSRKGAFRPRGITQAQAYTSLRQLAPFELGVVIGTSALAFVAMVVATFWTAPTALMFGALAVAFSAFAFLVAGGSMLSFLSAWARFPVDLTVVILAFLLSFAPWTDNHGVRVLEREATAMPPSERPSLDVALENWRKALGEPQEQPTFVIVATAGGGLRAATWTQVVLGEIEDRARGFHKQLFAISGVSGGSFGAAVFNTLLTLEDSPLWKQCDGDGAPSFGGRARCILEQDYLAPAVSGLLYPDLLQRFIPLPRPLPRLPDRAMAAEQGWEQGWKNRGIMVGSNESPLSRPFLGLWSGCSADQGCWRPALLLNGTHVETGKRIITSNLKIDAATFTDATDIYALIGHDEDFRVSTAINNSARFPYVAPAGTLQKNGEDTAHIVDGGYFENFGASTAAELLRAAHGHFEARGMKVRPIVIQISSDPALTEERLPACIDGQQNEAYAAEFKTEAFAPIDSLFATREARGIFAAKELCRLAVDTGAPPAVARQNARPGEGEQKNTHFFHFRMCSSPAAPSPGLGWSMSRESFNLISSFINQCGNKEQLQDLVSLLAGTTAGLVSPPSDPQ